MFKLPVALLWRKKDVLGLGGGGVVTAWSFRQATEKGTLKGIVVPGRTYHKYKRDDVCRAFGLRGVDAAGRAVDVMRAEFAELK